MNQHHWWEFMCNHNGNIVLLQLAASHDVNVGNGPDTPGCSQAGDMYLGGSRVGLDWSGSTKGMGSYQKGWRSTR